MRDGHGLAEKWSWAHGGRQTVRTAGHFLSQVLTDLRLKNKYWAVSSAGLPRGAKPQKVQSMHTYMNSDNFIISYNS